MKSISKELFIMALLLMVVVFMVGMVCYQYMPNNKTVPEPITYSADSSTTSVLQEISASDSYSTESNDSSVQDVIKSYSIGTTELTTAAAKQTYVSGKTDPFAEAVAPEPNTADANTTNSNTVENGAQTNTQATQTTPAKSDPNSTGTFFEQKGSK